MTHSFLVLGLLAATGALFACGSAEDDPESTEDDVTSTRTQYLDISQYLQGDDVERWYEAQRGLVQGFDQICGDTFCGGDFSNLYSLGFGCTVTSKIGKMRECLWTFAGSQEQVDAKTGTIASHVGFFECRIKPTGNAKNFVASFGDEPLRSQIPGLDGSIYDQLGACFQQPVGYQPLPEQTEGSYADALDVLGGETADAYDNAIYAAKNEFDAICGDTFCEGEYSNLQSLSLRCSQNEAGALGECSWTIAGSDTSVDSRGMHKVKGAPFVCKVPVVGTAADLASALSPSGEGALFDRTLPGGGTLLDALGNCL